MIKLLIFLVILVVAADVAVARCKHRSREVFYPSPHNEHINFDDVLPIDINRHPHHKRVSDQINTEKLDDEIRKILPDVLKGDKNKRQDDPVVHISVEYDDKGKVEIDENDRVKPIHRISKKDHPDWLDDRDYINQDWIIRDDHRNRKHRDDWEIKRDDSDVWKRERTEWDFKDTEHKVWENNKPYVNWDNIRLDYDKRNNQNNNNNDGSDLLLKNINNPNIMVPQLVFDRTDDKNGLVELSDNIYDFVSNTTNSLGQNLHNLGTDLLNVNINLKPLLSSSADGDLTIDPITVKRNNKKSVSDNSGGYKRNNKGVWDQSYGYPK